MKPDGTCTVAIPTGFDSLEVWVDAAEKAGRNYFPSWTMIAHPRSSDEVGFVLVPRVWTFTAGCYVGQSVAIDPASAFRQFSLLDAPRSFYERYPTVSGHGWEYAIGSWPKLPILVAFDHSTAIITANDSIRFWNEVAAMNRCFVQTMFQPTSSVSLAAVVISVDPTIGGAYGQPTSVLDQKAWGFDYSAGVAAFQSTALFANGFLTVTHELLHVLGFGHTCSWPSVMGGGGSLTDGTPCPMTPTNSASLNDVAYALLLYQTLARQRQYNAGGGMKEALWGEQKFMLNTPPDR